MHLLINMHAYTILALSSGAKNTGLLTKIMQFSHKGNKNHGNSNRVPLFLYSALTCLLAARLTAKYWNDTIGVLFLNSRNTIL